MRARITENGTNPLNMPRLGCDIELQTYSLSLYIFKSKFINTVLLTLLINLAQCVNILSLFKELYAITCVELKKSDKILYSCRFPHRTEDLPRKFLCKEHL